MNGTNFIKRVKIAIPKLGTGGIQDADILELVSQAVDEVNLFAKVYKGFTDFNITANLQTYSLSSVAPNYLGPVKIPLKFKDANNKWQKVYPKTLPWIEQVYPDWLNASSTPVPKWYWIDGDELGFHFKPSTTKTSGARLYHLKKGTPIAAGTFPFTGSSTELIALRPLDEAIIAWIKWKLEPSFGANTDIDIREREYMKLLARAARQIRRRPDYTSDSAYGGIS